jgi:cardiolipin synthase
VLLARHPRIARVLKIAIVSLVVTATVLAIAQDQETVQFRSALSAEDPAAGEYLAALVAADLVHGNTFGVLINGDQVFPAMLQAIDAARERVSFETYVYEEGRVAGQFTDALERAARRGVTVNVILDAIGTVKMARSQLKRLEEAGCHVLNFNPTAWYTLEDLNYRTHRKILVIDGSVAFTGESAWPITGLATPSARNTGATPTFVSRVQSRGCSKRPSTRTSSAGAMR